MANANAEGQWAIARVLWSGAIPEASGTLLDVTSVNVLVCLAEFPTTNVQRFYGIDQGLSSQPQDVVRPVLVFWPLSHVSQDHPAIGAFLQFIGLKSSLAQTYARVAIRT